MKTRITLSLLAISGIFLLTACETTSFERGVLAGEAAKAIFDAPQDEAKFQQIKADIVSYLATDKPITTQIVSAYLERIELDFSPAFIQIVKRRLDTELPELDALDDARIREFLTGVAATL